MSDPLEKARELIDRFSRFRPGAVELATLASLAVRIELELLRALRLHLAPHLDVGTEADLWFSPLVQGRGPEGISLVPEISELLRKRLQENRERLDGVWQILQRCHRSISPALHLEERVSWLALSKGEASAPEIDDALAPALVALVREGRTGLAHWAARALPRLPAEARSTRVAWMLNLAASQRLERRTILEFGAPGDLLDMDVSEILPDLPETDLAIRLAGEELSLGDVAGGETVTVRIADTVPRLVEIRWQRDGKEARKLMEILPGATVRWPVGSGSVHLRTLTGAVYELRSGHEEPSPSEIPAESPLEPTVLEYDDFLLRLEPGGSGGEYRVLASSPRGEGWGTFISPYDPKDRFRSMDLPVLTELGGRLFEALFHGIIRNLFEGSLGLIDSQPNRGLRILISLDSQSSPIAHLFEVPWEILYWPERKYFLGLDRRTPIVRFLETGEPLRLLPSLSLPLRILLVISRPASMPQLSYEDEIAGIMRSLGRRQDVEITVLDRATLTSIREALHSKPFHVFHFVGHTTWEKATGEGALILENEEGQDIGVRGGLLSNVLLDHGSLRLVFLNTDNAVEVLGPSLTAASIPAVVMMRGPVTDRSAVTFAEAFYRSFAADRSPVTAISDGRMAIHLSYPDEWAAPVLFLRSGSGELFETAAGNKYDEIRKSFIDFSQLIAEKSNDFVGREWVFDAVDHFLEKNPRGCFLLQGDPGSGKTSILAEMVRRRGYVHHFNVRLEGIRTREAFLDNISAQLIVKFRLDYDVLPVGAMSKPGFLQDFLEEVVQASHSAEKIIIVIDALDEVDTSKDAPGENVLGLPSFLPPGVYVVASSRRGNHFTMRIDCERATLSLEGGASHNLEDLRQYIQGRLSSPGLRSYMASQEIDEDTLLSDLLDRSEGNFSYLTYVLQEIERGGYRTGELPVGLQNYYEDHWQRMRSRDQQDWFAYELPVLVALTVVREPISLDLIGKFSGIEDRRQVRTILARWEPFLQVVKTGEEVRYSLYHASFMDFILSKVEVADERMQLQESHRRIAEALIPKEDVFDLKMGRQEDHVQGGHGSGSDASGAEDKETGKEPVT